MTDTLVLDHAKRLFGVELVKIMPKGYTQNRVYETAKNGTHYFLRVSPHTEEKLKYTAFEVNWMHYLATRMKGIVCPQKSVNDRLCEVCKIDEKPYIFCLFEKAPGQKAYPDDPNVFNKDLFFKLGKLMGQMHDLSVQYPDNRIVNAFEWDDPTNSWRYQNTIQDADVRACQTKYHDLLRSLPIDPSCYGPIHWDLHLNNFMVDNGDITVFDFDGFQYNWYAADIASAIFFLIMWGAGPLTSKSDDQRDRFAQNCTTIFLKGYLQSRPLNAFWIRKLDWFIKYQLTDEYLAGQCMTDWEHQEWYMQWHKNRIVNDASYANIDYDRIIKELHVK